MKKQVFLCVTVVSMMLTLMGCGGGSSSKGGFKTVDGKEVYMIGKNQVFDELVEDGGDYYYVDKDGAKVKSDWAVIDNDGNYAYFGAKGQMIKDQVKEIDGKLYLFDANGALQKDGKIVYNGEIYYANKDGDLLCEALKVLDGKDCYFDENGKSVKKEGWVQVKSGDFPEGTYFLDENGQRKVSAWEGDYYLDNLGKMVVNQWIGEYYVGPEGTYLKNTVTPDGKRVGADGKLIVQTYSQNNSQSSVNNASADTSAKQSNEEFFIEKNERVKATAELDWTSANDEYNVDTCEIIVVKPIIGGINQEQVNNINAQIEELVNKFVEHLQDPENISKEGYIGGAFNSIKILESKIKVTDNKVTITCEGDGMFTNAYKKNNSTFVGYTIVYDKRDNTSTLKNTCYNSNMVNSDVVFTAD